MEAVTAFIEGPGCFLIVWGLCARKAWRYVAVVLVSLGQLYGDVLYFGTCLHGGGCGRGWRPGRGRGTPAALAALRLCHAVMSWCSARNLVCHVGPSCQLRASQPACCHGLFRRRCTATGSPWKAC